MPVGGSILFLASYATEERTTDDSREGLPPEIHALGERAAGCAHIGRELCDRPPGRDASALPIRLVASFRRPRPSLVAWLPGSLWIAGKHQFGVSIYSHSMRQAAMRAGAWGRHLHCAHGSCWEDLLRWREELSLCLE